MIKLSDFRTENALPAEMKTAERKSLTYAFDRQKKKFIERISRLYIWADLEKVDDDKLDFLAVEQRVLFYNTNLEPDVKRKLILNSIYWYMKLGTRQAMEEMIDIVFGNENTSVEEWYTYSGEPYHFRIAVGTEVSQTSISEFLSYLNKVKNSRSRFDFMIFQNGIKLSFAEVSEYTRFIYTFCGECDCGTYPETEIGFQQTEAEITLEGDTGSAVATYEQAGTTPDISIGAALPEGAIDFQGSAEENTVVYASDGEEESGTTPDISIGAALPEGAIDFRGSTEENMIVYASDSEAESGTTPDISIGAALAEVQTDLQGESAQGTAVAEESGTIPDISVGAQFCEVQADFQGGSDIYFQSAEVEAGSVPDPAIGFAETESGVSVLAESDSYNLYYNTDAEKSAGEE